MCKSDSSVIWSHFIEIDSNDPNDIHWCANIARKRLIVDTTSSMIDQLNKLFHLSQNVTQCPNIQFSFDMKKHCSHCRIFDLEL